MSGPQLALYIIGGSPGPQLALYIIGGSPGPQLALYIIGGSPGPQLALYIIGGSPEHGHEGSVVHWVDKHVAHQLWLGRGDPQDERVTGTQTHLQEEDP